MEQIKGYLISVTAAALICGAVSTLIGKTGSTSKLIKLLCGLFLTATVIKPVAELKLDEIYAFTEQLELSSNLAVSNGEEMASDEMKRIIKEKTEAYILDKAKVLGADVEVEVMLADMIPAGVCIEGEVAPFARTSLSACISQDLGIPPEEQIWNRP